MRVNSRSTPCSCNAVTRRVFRKSGKPTRFSSQIAPRQRQQQGNPDRKTRATKGDAAFAPESGLETHVAANIGRKRSLTQDFSGASHERPECARPCSRVHLPSAICQLVDWPRFDRPPVAEGLPEHRPQEFDYDNCQPQFLNYFLHKCPTIGSSLFSVESAERIFCPHAKVVWFEDGPRFGLEYKA